MSERQPELLVEDIIEYGNKILSYAEGFTFQDFIKDSKTIETVIRNFEIIGEAANRFAKISKTNILLLIGIE